MSVSNTIFPLNSGIQLRGGTSTALTAKNPTPAAREIMIETDTNKFKIGNGTTSWNSLKYSLSGGKAPTLILSKTDIKVNIGTDSPAITVLSPSTGTITATSNDESIATVSVSNGAITITGVSEGSTLIIVNTDADTSHIEGSAAIQVTVADGVEYGVFGYRIDKNNSDPATRVEYLYDAVGKTPAHMNFDTGKFDYGDWDRAWFVRDNKPCMLKTDGTVDYYLNPDNYGQKEDGTASDVANTSYGGNAMAQIPLIWIKRYEDADYYYEIVSNTQYDADFKAYAHTRADGTIADYFYWGLFGASGDASKTRSLSGQTRAGTMTAQDFIDGAGGNGSKWYIHTWSQRECIRTLLILMGKSTDTQTVYGIGNVGGSGQTNILTTGTLKDKGQFYGYNTVSKQVKVFHIEAFWGEQWAWTAGLLANDGTVYAKMTPEGSGYRVTDVTGYTSTGVTFTGTTGGYIKKYSCSDYGMIFKEFNGSETTYVPDYGYINIGGLKFLYVGAGATGASSNGGAFTAYLGHAPSYAYWNVGGGLSLVMPAA